MAFSTLTKAQSQATPYFWVWKTNGTASLGEKRIGTTIFYLRGQDDTSLLARINAHEGYRDAAGRAVHG